MGIAMLPTRNLLLLLALLPFTSVSDAAEEGQYRSKILIDPANSLQQGTALTIRELEQQLASMNDPYAIASGSRHLARHYLANKEYSKAIDYYRSALQADGLAEVANIELRRELARAYLLNKNPASAVASFEKVLAAPQSASSEDYLLMAQAQYQLKDHVGVVETLDQLRRSKTALDDTQLRRAMALYYRAGGYQQAALILEELLVREPENAEFWHQLGAVYLQQNKQRKAVDHLALAYSKGVSFSEDQLLLLADLYAANNNPNTAAELLEREIQSGRVAAKASSYQKLFELWLQARDKDKALPALARAARYSNDITLHFYLAQLQMERDDYQAMYRTMLAACAEPLHENDVSRANLLLGISQLKLGDRESARRSFINASLIGGATSEAAQWMQFMDAAPATKQEARQIVGICHGPDDRAQAAAVLPPGAMTDEDSAASIVTTKTVEALRLYGASYRKPLQELGTEAPGLAIRLTISLIRAGGEASGPLHLIGKFPASEIGAIDVDTPRDFILALPVSGNPSNSGRYAPISTEPWECSFIEYKGRPEGIADAWRQLVSDTLESGLVPTGETRTVFKTDGRPARGAVHLELQLGVE